MSTTQAAPSSIDPRRASLTVAACVALAIAALAVPATLAYDPWAWMVWGRELVHLELDTTGGPSWKPLPVVVTALLTPFGSFGPTIWLVVARTGGLLALVGCHRLARRLGGRAAGALAVGLLLLTPDRGPRFTRLVLEGHSAPVTAGLALWAVERHLAGRPRSTLILLGVLALDRPEAWPFLGLYGLWLARRDPVHRWLVGAIWVAIPLLWFGGDWWGSGSPLHGADTAQVSSDEQDRVSDAVERAAEVVVAPAWVAVAVGVGAAWRARLAAVPAMAAAALAWMGLVVVMSATLGYAAVPRFHLPAAGLLCVVAAVGAVRGLALVREGPRRVAVLVVALALSAPAVAQRVGHLPGLLDEVRARARADEALVGVLDDIGGPDRLRACGPLSIDSRGVPRPAVAWRTGLPLAEVRSVGRDSVGVMIVRAGGKADARLGRGTAPVSLLARNDGWAVYASACPGVP